MRWMMGEWLMDELWMLDGWTEDLGGVVGRVGRA